MSSDSSQTGSFVLNRGHFSSSYQDKDIYNVNLNIGQSSVLFVTVIRDNSQQGTNHWGEIQGRK